MRLTLLELPDEETGVTDLFVISLQGLRDEVAQNVSGRLCARSLKS